MNISKEALKEAKMENILRLAKYLRLNITSMSLSQIINLVKWRITRTDFNRH